MWGLVSTQGLTLKILFYLVHQTKNGEYIHIVKLSEKNECSMKFVVPSLNKLIKTFHWHPYRLNIKFNICRHVIVCSFIHYNILMISDSYTILVNNY